MLRNAESSFLAVQRFISYTPTYYDFLNLMIHYKIHLTIQLVMYKLIKSTNNAIIIITMKEVMNYIYVLILIFNIFVVNYVYHIVNIAPNIKIFIIITVNYSLLFSYQFDVLIGGILLHRNMYIPNACSTSFREHISSLHSDVTILARRASLLYTQQFGSSGSLQSIFMLASHCPEVDPRWIYECGD